MTSYINYGFRSLRKDEFTNIIHKIFYFGGREMAVPKWNELIDPVIRIIDSKDSIGRKSLSNEIASLHKMNLFDIQEVIPRTNVPKYRNNLAWTTIHLKKLGVITEDENKLAITKLGKRIIQSIKGELTYDNVKDFVENKKDNMKKNEINASQETPEEMIESISNQITDKVSQDLKRSLKKINPSVFEKLVVDLLLKMGYGDLYDGAGKVTGGPNDQGIDGIINQDRLGLDKVYIQAKRWKGTVGSKEIQGFTGALVKEHSDKGVFITTGTFSKMAISFAKNIDKNIILIDGDRLSKLMIEHKLGVVVDRTYEIMKVDENMFPEDSLE
jgi:restriction system protein